MADFQNTLVYPEDWAESLQQALDEPNKWKEICNVEYTNSKVLNNPYLTDPTVQTGTRGCSFTYQALSETNESISITTYKNLPIFVDRADLAQSKYARQMEIAARQGVLLNEAIETAVFAAHASMTDFGSENLSGSNGSTQITVSATNVDDIILNVERTIIAAAGAGLLQRNGGFIVWRPADWALLRAFMAASGFSTADRALNMSGEGASLAGGIDFMGFTHYTSNLLATNHNVAGVKKLIHLGILKDTYGQVTVVDDPQGVSGVGFHARVDYAVKVWTNTKPVIFDVNVA